MVHVVQGAAVRALDCLHTAENDLVGRGVITFGGEAGTCKEVRLDDHHGICFTFDDPLHPFDEIECGKSRRWFPVSTIRGKE